MLSRGSSCLEVGSDLEGEKVYSAVIVFVHPRQELLSIKEGAEFLIQLAQQLDPDVSVLCELPSHKHGRFYPSAVNHAYLILPYCATKGNPKKLCLDLAMCYNRNLLVRHLHRWEGRLGDLALLSPVFSADPTLPILLPVGFIGELWLNDTLNAPVAAGGTGLGKARPAISRLTCCRQEVIACKTLANWTGDERIVYPSPVAPMPKDDKADESDDDWKSEHGDGSGEDATNKKEDQESEDVSDDQSKAPEGRTAVVRDSSLGTSSLGVEMGAKEGASASNLGADLDAGLPLPTRLPSMDLLETLANDLYAYNGELFRGLEETSMAMLDRVLSGFKRSGGRAREYIYETAAIAINFLSRAGDMEADLESSEALKFREAVKGMEESICDLARRATLVTESYAEAAANFDNILSSVSDELREFVESQGKEQHQVYIAKCMEWIRGVHGSLDGTQFIPMVVSNVTMHHALTINQRVNHS